MFGRFEVDLELFGISSLEGNAAQSAATQCCAIVELLGMGRILMMSWALCTPGPDDV